MRVVYSSIGILFQVERHEAVKTASTETKPADVAQMPSQSTHLNWRLKPRLQEQNPPARVRQMPSQSTKVDLAFVAANSIRRVAISTQLAIKTASTETKPAGAG
jgi:hypothetical protein